ncbi:MAG: exonuclease domain-containing protein [bacterium]|nr:exonuclease domain-containing protein [bacterium]
MFVSLDLETTGFDAKTDKIIEFGAIKFDLSGPGEKLQFLVDPGHPIPQIVTHITRISDKDLKDAPSIDDKLEEIKTFIGDYPIVGHNIQFDIGFLRSAGLEINNPEYDTQVLSGILIPNLPSYSLEILTEILDLKHAEKHRALDDAIAAMELFTVLIEKFRSIDPKLLKKIQTLCGKSNWALTSLIQKLKPNDSQKNEATQKPKTKVPTLKSNYKKILDEDFPALFEEIPPYNKLAQDLANQASADTYIAVSKNLFQEIEAEIPNKIAKIDVAKSYISTFRLSQFENSAHFKDEELIALLKILVWIEQTDTGLLNEVALYNEERSIIQKVNLDPNILKPDEEHFWKKALEKDKESAAICTHQYLIENTPENGELIIIDYENFYKSLHFHQSNYLKLDFALEPLNSLKELEPENQTLESLSSKTTILFGLIGIIFEKTNDQNQWAARSTIDETILATKEWNDAINSVKRLIEISKELGDIKNESSIGYLKRWKSILEELDKLILCPEIDRNFLWIEKDYHENIVIRKIPFQIDDKIEEFLPNSKIITQDIELSKPSPEIKTINLTSKSENLDIFIATDCDDYNKNQIPNFLIEYLKNSKERCAIILNSRKQLEYFTLKLSQADIPTVSQMASGLGKLTEQFKNTPEATLLLTPNAWEVFKNKNDIETLFIHKVPFDPPSEAFLVAQSKNLRDPWNELQIPRAILALKKIINGVRNNNKVNKKALILDSRLVTKGYGRDFQEKLKEIARVSEIKLENFQH